MPAKVNRADVTVENLQEEDLAEADRIFRLAFGTFIGLPDPSAFHKGADYIRTRWKTDPAAAFAAKVDGKLAGTNFATTWGSVGFFGPLTIHPDYWDRGIGQSLMPPIMQVFAAREVKHAGLFTFAQSQKHVGLYQKFGFWPRFLTAIMSRQVDSTANGESVETFSALDPDERTQVLELCTELTNEIYAGFDVVKEILAVADQRLGDTVLIRGHDQLVGLAICHAGEGSEAGPDVCYVKFGAARPGPNAAANFDRLLVACDSFAASRALSRLVLGVNTGRREAYEQLMSRRFKTDLQGVAMHRPDEPGFSRPGDFVIDDWR
jgi:N-acetylglutamate synthase-like GNAT family acetyltransferase